MRNRNHWAVSLTFCSIIADECYEGRVLEVGDEYVIQDSQHGLVRHHCAVFKHPPFNDMKVSIYYLTTTDGYCTWPSGAYWDAEWMRARLESRLKQRLRTNTLEDIWLPAGKVRLLIDKYLTHDKTPAVYITELRSHPPLCGCGSIVMNELMSAADDVGARLALRVCALGKEPPLNYQQLATFYSKYGFVETVFRQFVREGGQ